MLPKFYDKIKKGLLSLWYYARRLKTLGIRNSMTRLIHRFSRLYSYGILKIKYKLNCAATTGPKLCKKLNIKNFEQAFEQLKKNDALQKMLSHPEFYATIPDTIKNKMYPIPMQTTIFNTIVDTTNVDWQADAQIQQQTTPLSFYRDIKIKIQQTKAIDDYFYDIKFPWELSRMHQLTELGFAYNEIKNKNDNQAQEFARSFVRQTLDWIEKNRYLGGVNWVCPMDVAIRATNFIWAFHFFKNDPTIKSSFWQTLICSLFDHANYLEQNWETSATPNNHYLADLIGYNYLCVFFESIDQTSSFKQKKIWCLQKLREQFKLQFLSDGTQYEGSTSYHRLVTEFYLHFCFLNHETITLQEKTKLQKMFDFISTTMINEHEFIQIGDTDSGKFVFGITTPLKKEMGIKQFPDFGLTVTRTDNWLISQRNFIRQAFQPSGHFHEDENSITLSIGDQPIIVDPGSYLYTANNYARNLFRSQTMHNGPQLYKKTKDSLRRLRSYELETIDLFTLPQNDNHDFLIERKLNLDHQSNLLKIQDFIDSKSTLETVFIHWNFIFHPSVDLIEQENNWILRYKTGTLILNSNLTFTKQPNYYAPEYGTKEICWSLSAQELYRLGTRYELTLKQITNP